jgi:hypothetical protein
MLVLFLNILFYIFFRNWHRLLFTSTMADSKSLITNEVSSVNERGG